MEKENYFWHQEEIITNDKIYVLIIYDIIDNRRRNKLAKKLEGFGFRVQKSAFEALIKDKQYEELKAILPQMIDKDEDSIRIYKFRGYGEVSLFGINSKIQNEDVIII